MGFNSAFKGLDIITRMNLIRRDGVEYIARGGSDNVHSRFVGIPGGKRPLRVPRSGGNDNE